MWPRSRNILVSAQLAFKLMTNITINHFFVGSLAKTQKLSWVFFAGERASIDNGLIMEFFSTWQWEYWLPACLSAPMTLSATMIASRWAFSIWLLKIEESFDDTMKERKWWCFLLSSIFTFIMGVVSVLLVRALASIFCRKVSAKVKDKW